MKKKYPFLISAIISCVIVIASLFVMGFCGPKLSYSLGGGSQFKVYIETDADTYKYTKDINGVLNKYGYKVDSAFVADEFHSGTEDVTFTRKALVVQIADNVADEKKDDIKADVADVLSVEATSISDIEKVTSSVATKQILFLALALGIIIVCFFVFAWIRYNLFAGLTFVISFLHNVILYLSIIILTRLQLSHIAILMCFFLSLVMSTVLIYMFEKNRELSNQSDADKFTVTERMLKAQKQTIFPFIIVGFSFIAFACIALLINVSSSLNIAYNLIIATLVTAYTISLIAPASYSAMYEIKEMNDKAILSRNDTVNKAIKKKIKQNSKAK